MFYPSKPGLDPQNLKHVVSIGGGIASTIELPLLVKQKYGNFEAVISCLRNEAPDLWRLVTASEQMTGVQISKVSYRKSAPGKYAVNLPEYLWPDIWDVFWEQGFMGSSLADPCSRVLKRETMAKYMLATYDPAQTCIHFGITSGEIDRTIAIAANWIKKGFSVEFDLADTPQTESSAQKAKRLLGWVPQNYVWGMSHNNCGGFCVKAGHNKMAKLLHYAPDVFYHHAQREAEFQRAHKTEATIMRHRKTVLGKVVSEPLSLYCFADEQNAKKAGAMFSTFDDDLACVWCDAGG